MSQSFYYQRVDFDINLCANHSFSIVYNPEASGITECCHIAEHDQGNNTDAKRLKT